MMRVAAREARDFVVAGTLGALLAFLATNHVHAQPLTVELRAAAEVPGARVTLGDVADITGNAGARQRRLAALIIADTPRMGYSKTFSRQGIERQVQRLSPEHRGQLRWSGAARVTVRGKGQRVESSEVVDAAALALARLHAEHYKSLELRPIGEHASLDVPAGKVDLRARPLSVDPVSRRVGARVEVRIDGHPYRTVPVWFEGKALRPVMTARQLRQPGDVLRTDDFQWSTLDIAAYTTAPVPAEDLMVQRLRLKRPLAAGEPLLREHVEERPAVARHDHVKVALAQGGIVVEAAGIALADARVGEAVSIRNPDSSEHYAALVVAPGVVRVDLR